MSNEKPEPGKQETALERAVHLVNGHFERIGTSSPPTKEETRVLIYDVMSALVLAKLQGRTKEVFICQEMLDLVLLTEVALGRAPSTET